MAVVTIALTVIGMLFLLGKTDAPTATAGEPAITVARVYGLWIGIAICVYMACIALSICAVIWILTPEIFPNRVRGRAVSIATFFNWATNSLSIFLFPWYVAKFGMHAGFITCAGICLVATLFFWRFVPETKGRSLEEIEKMWQR